jgi:hypothetical protein
MDRLFCFSSLSTHCKTVRAVYTLLIELLVFFFLLKPFFFDYDRNEYPEKLLWLYRTIGWGYPGVVVIFLLLRQLTGHLGIGGADRRWCWISTHESTAHAIVLSHWKMEGALHQLLLFYVPLGFVLVFNIIIYGRILRFLRADPMVYRIRLRIYLYLGIFIGCYSWGIINRLIQFFNKPYHVPNKYLTLMECICDPLQPLLSTIVYGFNKRSIEGYKQKFCSRWFYAQLSSSSEGEEDEDSSTQVVSHQERFLSQVAVQNLVTPQGPLSPSSSTHFSPMLFPQRLLIGERGRDRGQRYKQQQRQQQQQKEDSKKIPFLP